MSGVWENHRLLKAVTGLAVSSERSAAIRNLSHQLGVESLIVFIPDSELGTLLPAPGFPQTLPSARNWRAFLKSTLDQRKYTVDQQFFRGLLPWKNEMLPAQGFAGSDGSVVVLLGQPVADHIVQEFSLLLPLLSAALNAERAVTNASAKTSLAREIAEKSQDLAKRLDEARREAQKEISARIKAEEKVRLANETLEIRVQERTKSLTDAVSQLEEFSYTIAHDLRAPLRAIFNFAAILESDFHQFIPAEGQGYLDRIKDATTRMDNLTNDVLFYTRVARAEFPLSPLCLDELVEEIISQFRVAAPNATLSIEKPLGKIIGNKTLLGQCLNNLLDNAVKYAHPERPVAIHLRAADHGANKRLLIQDNGLGILPQYQERIFKIFERIEVKQPGTGVGLAIARRAMDRMNGRIGVFSNSNCGSTFWIELPAVDHVPA